MTADETIVNVVNDPKRRASPRRNYDHQHPLAEKPKVFNNEGFSRGLKLPQLKTETKQIASKWRRDISQSVFYCRTVCSNTDRSRQTCGVYQ